jgi:hypothetical protein
LGNLAYDSTHKQLFVSDLYTGMIHRFDLNGNELGRYDHGVTGLGAAKLATVPFDPKNRPNIANARFDSEKPDTWGFAPAARRVWGLAVQDSRLYYSVAAGPQIWSVGIASDGSFAADPRWELDVPAQAGPLPVSDIAFSHPGAMILAQRALIAGAYDYSAFTQPGEPKVLRFWLKGPNDPPSPGRWKPVPEEYAVGFAGNYRNTNGGVALGYGYGQDGTVNTTVCEAALWTTGQNLRNNPALRSQLEPGGPLVVHGLQGSPADLVRNANTPPATSYFVDYDDAFDDPGASGHIGSVRVYMTPCAAVAAVSGPAGAAAGGSGGGGGGGGGQGPACFAPTSLSLPPCTKPGQLVTLDLSTAASAGVDPNWTVTPGGPNAFKTNLGAWTALPGNWVQPTQSATPDPHAAAGLYTYTRRFNLPCSPESYQKGTLSLTGRFAADNSVLPPGVQLNGHPAIGTTCVLNNCFSTPAGGTPFSITNPAFFVQGTNVLTVPVTNSGLYTGLSVVAKLEAMCGSECVCGCPPDTVLEGKECVKVGAVIIEKEVTTHGTLIPWPAGIQFPMTLTCAPPPQTWSFSLAANGTYTANNIPFGSTCTVAEGSMPAFPPGLCPRGTVPAWLPPPFTTPASVVINGTTVTMIVHNSVTCVDKQIGSLIVKKQVIYDGPVTLPSQIYPVTVNCGGTITQLNLLDGVPQTVNNIPLGTSCSVVEGTVPTPPNICRPPSTPVWSTTYVPPSPITITGMGITELVKNTLTCRLIRECPPPLVLGPADQCICPPGTVLVGKECVKREACLPPLVLNAGGICGCPPGTVLRGKECVRPIDCRAPLVPNATGTDCVCRPGLVLRGGKCVEPIVCKPPATLNRAGTACTCPRGMVSQGNTCVEPEHNPRIDIHRGLPGMGRPGGEGGNPFGGRGGGEGPHGGGGNQGGTPGRQ